MIFSLFFGLIMMGYAGCGLMLGSYMRHYTGASSLDLGFVFMLQPLCVFLRLFISAQADRQQSHKSLLIKCVLLNAVAYTPFVVVPFLLEYPRMAEILTQRILFWILAGSHLLGSVGFCGTRTLGDALAVNFAKRTGSDYSDYRKFGSISFGSSGFLLGYINQNWIVPDFVPLMAVNCICMTVLGALLYLWPDEYFVIGDGSREQDSQDKEIPTGSELARRIGAKLCHRGDSSKTDLSKVDYSQSKQLTTRQQVGIFLLLLRRDIRIPLFLLFLFYGGLTGYAPQNFVYTYMNISCDKRGTCDGSQLAGLTMLVYCIFETLVYMIVSRFQKHFNYFYVLEVTFVSLAFHYYFYGFLIDDVSPYFFLMESLHGLEYGLSLSTCCELGHKFASEVELIIPELEQREIIDENTDLHLVRVSLMATMNGCFTLVYDGFGTIVGAFMYGMIIEKTSYQTNWFVVGSMASLGVIISISLVNLGKCLGVRPQIERIAASNTHNHAKA